MTARPPQAIRTRKIRKPVFFLALIFLGLTGSGPLQAGGPVDPALAGTWKLEWQGGDILWVVRPDGVYRLHGPGAAARQIGHIEASGGKWSIRSAVWSDRGTYQLQGKDTWLVSGLVGTGTWKRVWSPQQGGARNPEGPGACGFVSPGEVAHVFYAPVSGKPDVRAGENGCMFRSQFSSLDQLSISVRQNPGNFFQNSRKSKTTRAINVPNVGDQAYAELPSNGELFLQFLKGSTWVTFKLRLTPDAVPEDIPFLAELARAAAKRV